MSLTFLVLGAGEWQVPIIQFLKKKGNVVIVADPHVASPGIAFADKHICVDIRNISQLIEATKNERFDHVISDQSDIAIRSVAQLADVRKIPFNSTQSVSLFTDKEKSRNFARDHGIPIPDFKVVSSPRELSEFMQSVNGPSIIKPVDSQSSRGVHRIDHDSESLLAIKFEESLTHSLKSYVLAEEFINGFELTLEGICMRGKHITLTHSKKKHFRSAIASDLEYPSGIDDRIIDEIIQVNNRYVENTMLKYGITHAEYMLDPTTGRFYLVELACRGGGSLISSHLVPHVTGIDIYELLYNAILYDHPLPLTQKDVSKLSSKYALLHFYEFPEGKIKEVSGIEAIRATRGVAYFNTQLKAGMEIQKASDDRSRHAILLLLTESQQEASSALHQINSHLRVSYS